MKFVMRAWGIRYDRTPQEQLGWVTKDGHVTSYRLDAKVYDSEAEAWEHAQAAGLIGFDDDKGAWVPGPEPVENR